MTNVAAKTDLQVVLKGLEVLTTLNQKNGLTVAELARILSIPRSTIFRLLKTLSAEGYIQPDNGRRYRLTKKVRGLCDNIQPEPWVNAALANATQDLHDHYRWPVAICSLRGDRILIDYVTDRQCPQLVTRRMVGYQLTFLDMASARVILAELPQQTQRELLRKVIQIESAQFNAAFGSMKNLVAALARIKKRGYDENLSKGFRVLAVPLHIMGTVAALSIRIPHLETAKTNDLRSVVAALRAAASQIRVAAASKELAAQRV